MKISRFVFICLSFLPLLSYAQVATPECAIYQYSNPTDNICTNFTSQEQKVAGNIGAPIDTGDTAWMLTATAFVMIMSPGLAFFYGGLCGASNVSNTIMMSFVSIAIVTLQWILVGYSFGFGPGNAGFGSFKWGALQNVGQLPSGAYAPTVPHLQFMMFQNMFAQITPALISGSLIGRMKFHSYVIFILLWSILVYDPLAHWVWSLTINQDWAVVPLGFLGKLPALDFAGGTVIHISSGFSALVAALMLGKRYNAHEPLRAHNVPMVMIGVTLLMFGWYGFNAGSAGAANGIAVLAFVNTHIAACTGLLMWLILETIFEGHQTPIGAANGIVAGLVGITPACGFINPMSSIAFGIIPAIFSYGAIIMKDKLGYDDTLSCFGLHGVSGIVGAIMTGLFANSAVNPAIPNGAFFGNPKLLLFQLAAITTAAAISTIGTFVILLVLKYTIGIRVSAEEEKIGLDESAHGGSSYHGHNNFSITQRDQPTV
jgi:Amt family ammonium transporter